MVEAALNLVWIALAVCAAARLAVRRNRRDVLATIAVVALLFPIISITDDLQLTASPMEETSAAALLHITVADDWAALCAPLFALTVVGQAVRESFMMPPSLARAASALRAPPTASIPC